MRIRIRHIATRFALLLTAAAVLPLVAYGLASVFSLQRGTRENVVAGTANVATRAATEIGRYISTNAELLKAVASDMQDTGLDRSQQDRILKNYILQFPEFREITLFDESGTPTVTSRAGTALLEIPKNAAATFSGVSMSAIRIDRDLLPTATFAIRLTRLNPPAGWLV